MQIYEMKAVYINKGVIKLKKVLNMQLAEYKYTFFLK